MRTCSPWDSAASGSVMSPASQLLCQYLYLCTKKESKLSTACISSALCCPSAAAARTSEPDSKRPEKARCRKLRFSGVSARWWTRQYLYFCTSNACFTGTQVQILAPGYLSVSLPAFCKSMAHCSIWRSSASVFVLFY